MHNTNDSQTGRAKTVLVFPAGGSNKAVITSIVAKAIRASSAPKISFKGSCEFDQPVRQHFQDTLLPITNEILQLLGIPAKSFEISAVNTSATSSSDIGIKISGYSADASAFLAMLSAGLNMPVRQDLVVTGHIASNQGDIAPVSSLPQKIDAAIADTEIKTIAYADPNREGSQKTLKPREFEEAVTALRRARGRVKLKEIRDITALIEESIRHEAIVSASFQGGFFEMDLQTGKEDGPVKQASAYLCRKNEQRFWKLIEHLLFSKEFEAGRRFIESFAEYHIDHRKYPAHFGAKLKQVILSLPPYKKRRERLFPLLDMGVYIQLVQFANESDHEDAGTLLNTITGKEKASIDPGQKASGEKNDTGAPEALIEYLLGELDVETVEQKACRKYDEARASFTMDKITVDSNKEFLDTITSYYSHLLRRTGSSTAGSSKDDLAADALDLLKKAFKADEDYNAVLAEAKCPTRGGMRYILDTLTDYLRQEAKEKYIFSTLKQAIDPLDAELRISLISAIINRESDRLSPDILAQPPERYANNYEEIIKAYAQSLTRVTERLKSL